MEFLKLKEDEPVNMLVLSNMDFADPTKFEKKAVKLRGFFVDLIFLPEAFKNMWEKSKLYKTISPNISKDVKILFY